MEETIIKFSEIEIEQEEFHRRKTSISLKNIDINKIVVSNMVSLGKKNGFKYFVGYKGAKKLRTQCVFLPKMSAYRRDFVN